MQRGSILIELVLGTTILGLTFVTLFVGLVTVDRFLGRSIGKATAITALRNELTIRRADGFATLTAGSSQKAISELTNGQLQTTIVDLEAELKEVTLIATWTQDGSSQTLSLVTRVAKDGLEAL